MSQEMDTLETKVKGLTTVVASAVAAFKGIAAQIRDAAGDRTKSLALATELDGDATDLAAAVAENTPTPAPTPAP